MKPFVKTVLITSAAFAGLAFAPGAFAQDSLEIRDFIGSVNWSNGPMSVEVEENAGDTKVTGRSNIIVDGGVENIDGKDCKSSYGSFDIDWFGKKSEGRFGGYKDLEDYPVLNISVPADTKLVIQNSIVFTLGEPDIQEADLELRHCGNVTLGDVENTLALNSRGSADVSVRRTGQIVASLKGSGDLTGEDTGDVLVKSHGSGDVDLGDAASIEVSLHGSGDLEAGNVNGSVDISSHGSGDVDLNDVEGSLTFSSHGSGDMEVSSVNGPQLYLKSQGSGDIDVGGGEVGDLNIITRGSGSVDYSGSAGSANLSSSGSGDVTVDRVDRLTKIKSSGSGDIEVGDGE